MSSSNMINPANYYNPFAKYNYVSKTRGVYIPRDSEPLLKTSDNQPKSASIYSDNYDAEADISQCMNVENNNADISFKFLNFINRFFDTDNQTKA